MEFVKQICFFASNASFSTSWESSHPTFGGMGLCKYFFSASLEGDYYTTAAFASVHWTEFAALLPSSSGLGRWPLTSVTRVRTPLGAQNSGVQADIIGLRDQNFAVLTPPKRSECANKNQTVQLEFGSHRASGASGSQRSALGEQ